MKVNTYNSEEGGSNQVNTSDELRKEIMAVLGANQLEQKVKGYPENKKKDVQLEILLNIIEAHCNKARIDELKTVNGWALGSHLNTASLHKWYSHYDNRTNKLKAQLATLDKKKEGAE